MKVEALPIPNEPANCWDLMLSTYGQSYRCGGIWRESWKYHTSMHRAVCRHRGPGSTHELGPYDTLDAAVSAAQHDLEASDDA